MLLHQNTDSRSKEQLTWIEKFRKVKPVALPTPDATRSIKDLTSARKSAVVSGLEPYTGEWSSKQAAHLLRRTLFGIKKSELDHFKSLTMSNAVDQIVAPSVLPAPPVNDYQGIDGVQDPTVGLGETWVHAPYAGDNKEANRIMSLKGWLINNILKQESTIHQKMVFFWHNLLVTSMWEVYFAKISYQYFKMLHLNALGNYKTMIRELTVDPAMLIFLNGANNNKVAPDENYGREIQELFCIGKGAGSHYTENDVKAAARVLTGWTINRDEFSKPGPFVSYFNPTMHDTGNKQFSAFYGNRIINGKSGADGEKELDEMLDMIFDNSETALYICRRLYTFFINNDITPTVEEKVIAPLATIFRNNNYDIAPVLKTLLKSTHFYDSQNLGVLIKSPLDHVLGLWRTMDVQPPDPGNLQQLYQIHTGMVWHMTTLGLELGDPPNVAGWPAYYQVPLFDQSWITTGTIGERGLTTDSLLYYGFPNPGGIMVTIDLLAFVGKLKQPSNPIALIQESAALLVGFELSDKAVSNLKNTLLTGQSNDDYWATAWNQYIHDPGNSVYKQTVLTRLQSTFRQLLQTGESHLM